MKAGRGGYVSVLESLSELASTLLIAGFVAGLAELSYIKAIDNASASGRHPGAFAAWMLSVAAPAIQLLRSRSLWELIPAFQIGTPFSVGNVPFWISVFVLVQVMRILRERLNFGKHLRCDPPSTLGALWKNHFLGPRPVNNYMVMINGPVTNSVTARTVGVLSQEGVQLSTAPAEFDEVAEELERLLQEIAGDRSLPEEKKQEARDLIGTITEEAKRPDKERRPAVLKALLSAVPVVISTAKSSIDLWGEIQPHLMSLFR